MMERYESSVKYEVKETAPIWQAHITRIFLIMFVLMLLTTGLGEDAFAREAESGYAYSPWKSTADVSIGKKNKKSNNVYGYTLSSLNKQGRKYYKALLKKGKKSAKKVKMKLGKKCKIKVSRADYTSGICWYDQRITTMDLVCFQAGCAVASDNPDLYWVDHYEWSYLYYYKKSKSSVSIQIVGVVFRPRQYYAGAKNELNQVKSVVNNVAANIMATRPDASRYTTARMIYEYLASVASYGNASGTEYSPAGALLGKYSNIAVCNGYALAFKMLCDACNIPCRYVGSEYYEHAWNMVQLEDGAWYGVDVTWGDNGSLADISYRWFMYGQNEVNSGAHAGREIHAYSDNRGMTCIEFALPALAPTTLLYG